jgi:DNA-binding transcriptional ArsR family regulator
MVDVYHIDSVTQIKAIAEPTRWRMYDLLVVRPMTGSQLARALKIPRTRAHYHLNILREAGLVELQHEGVNGGMVEKYYAAIARQLRTDRLVDRTRVAASQSGDDSGTGQVVRDLMLAMLELVRADILMPQALSGLGQAGFNWQDELRLTPDQTRALILALRTTIGQFVEDDRQNQLDVGAGPLWHLRLTSLLTPVIDLQFDPKLEDAHGAESQPASLP